VGGEADGSVTLRYLFTWKIALDFAVAMLVSLPPVIIVGLLWPDHVVVGWSASARSCARNSPPAAIR
jgi:hypothetical protein